MKIVFMGTPEFAVPSLDILLKNNYDIVGVVTATDKPSGRGKKLKQSPVKQFALEKGLEVLQPEKLKSPDFIEELSSLEADLFIVVAFRMLPEIVWAMPPKRTFNLHGSLLPQYRGAAPINWAIINGEKKTGVTTFFIEKEIDTGNIVFSEKIDIGENTTAGELHDEMMHLGAKLVLKTVKSIENNEVQIKNQNELIDKNTELKPAPKINKEICRIDWHRKAKQVHDHIRGLSPFPGAWSVMVKDDQKLIVKIYRTETKPEIDIMPGEILTDGKTYIYAGSAEGSVSILEIQLQGKKRLKTGEFLRGFRLNEFWFE